MVELSSQRLDRIFHALSDRTRRDILDRLSRGQASVSELATPFDMSFAAVSKHVKVLERAELLQQSKQGRIRICRLQPDALRQASEVIQHYERFWAACLDSLDRHLEDKRKQQKESS